MERSVKAIQPLPVLEKLKRVAVYCRVSSRFEEQIRSIGSQAKYLIDMTVHHPGWVFQGIYIDICSGSRAGNRTELQHMLTDARLQEIDIVLVRTVSRLGRDTVDMLQIMRELKSLGVEIIFADDHLSTMGADGELILTIITAIAEADNQSRKQNIQWGIQKRVKNGTSAFFKTKCYGYKINEEGEMVINEPEARIVRWIYKSFLSGNSRSLIQKQLLEAGIPSPSGNEKWCNQSLMNVLTNEKYYGAVCVYKSHLNDRNNNTLPDNQQTHEPVWWFDHHAPIISKKDYLAVQQEINQRCNYYIDENGKRQRKKTRYHSVNVAVEI